MTHSVSFGVFYDIIERIKLIKYICNIWYILFGNVHSTSVVSYM